MNYSSLCYGCFVKKSNQEKCSYCGYQDNSKNETTLNLSPGSILAGKYLIGRTLGQGGFGITYLGWDIKLDLKLAIKEYFPQGMVSRVAGDSKLISLTSADSNQFAFGLERFLLEAKTLARFNEFPGIVTVRDYFEENDTAYLVMSYHEGITLNTYLANNGGQISAEKAISIFMPILDALKEVHSAGILHRDISPDNLLINERGQVVLIDFGAARQAMGEKSQSLSVIMKAGYTPLEQYQSKGNQGPWTDIYAVAASIYRSITGKILPEAFDRLENDPIEPPSSLGIRIDPLFEKALLKAMAVKAEDRYQTVEEFQKALTVDSNRNTEQETSSALEESERIVNGDAKGLPFSKKETASRSNKKTHWFAIAALLFGLLIYFFTSYFSEETGDILTTGFDPVNDNNEEYDSNAEPVGQEAGEGLYTDLNADYAITHGEGEISLSELPIGAIIVDPSWTWEFRVGDDYTEGGEIKPVTWIVVAHDHYELQESHTTLLSEELLGRHAYDDSTDRQSTYGNNHWGDSGKTNAEHGLRPWLNSTGIHDGEGFYKAFSEDFKNSVLLTSLTNREWRDGSFYNTEDKVFLPSITELGNSEHLQAHIIGTVFSYFAEAGNTERIASIGGESWWYWTRTPSSRNNGFLNTVFSNGDFLYTNAARHSVGGIRPVINITSDFMVTEIAD